MSPENDKKLVDAFPDIFRDRSQSDMQSCMGRGFTCGDGWFKLIYGLCTRLDLLQKAFNIQIFASQVKEKFGTLRFYFYTEGNESLEIDNIVHNVISAVENESAHTCEECGEFGELRKNGWLSTLCDKCNKKVLEDK